MSTLLFDKKITNAAKADIIDLEDKISRFRNGMIDEEKFRLFRLTRGVYGQRQSGVQMFRTKIPFGQISPEQLTAMADAADEFTNGNLHLTTRQNIQLHYIKLDDAPAIWKKLEVTGITAREACGNTVRNITASSLAGIDPDELFDVAPYAQAVFKYFLRNPICQDMGRKIKMAFSASDKDSAYTFLHDFGFIPRVKTDKEQESRGFKVVVGGGLGAQAMFAHTINEFLPTNQLIPFIEAALRVFDRYGEREKRFKARLKFLVSDKDGIGIEKFIDLVKEEQKSLTDQDVDIDGQSFLPKIAKLRKYPSVKIDADDFSFWRKTNVIAQKQAGYYAVKVRIPLGNIVADKARSLAELATNYAADDIRITINQGLLLKYVRAEALENVYARLVDLGLQKPGAESIADVTACPGTDTCNLGVTNSTGVTLEIEKMIEEEYKTLISDEDLSIKISGCMNSCGQHMIASIGFHGSSIKNMGKVVPALQVVLGGGFDEEGKGKIADKVIKLPSKKILDAIRWVLDDYITNASEDKGFISYYDSKGKIYFYKLLKPLADLSLLTDSDYVDWGHNEDFIPEIGTGECAGASLDVVTTILLDAREKLHYAEKAEASKNHADAIYNSYSAMVVAAKALLLSEDIHCNTHIGIIQDFDTHFVKTGHFNFEDGFENIVLAIKKDKPGAAFTHTYFKNANQFIKEVTEFRTLQLKKNNELYDKKVISNFYKA